jgi:hypothetical protein
MDRTCRHLDPLTAVRFIKDRFLLPIFDDSHLGTNDVKLFLDLSKKGLTGSGLLFFAQREFNTNARQLVREAFAGLTLLGLTLFLLFDLLLNLSQCDFQLRFIKKITLEYLLTWTPTLTLAL